MIWKVPLAVVVLLVPAVVIRFALLASGSTPPENLGVGEQGLVPCPKSPNCVASRAEGAEHRVEPLMLIGDPAQAIERLGSIIDALPGGRVVEATPPYLRAEFRSRLFRFVDDVELLVDPEAARIEIRSASRVGHSDLGVNRKRVEVIRAAFE